MKRPLAYLTAAWSGEPDVDMELAAHYCFDLGKSKSSPNPSAPSPGKGNGSRCV